MPRDPGSCKKSRPRLPGEKREKIPNELGYSYPPNVLDYAKFVSQLQQIQMQEEQQDRPCYFSVEETPDKPGWFNNLFFSSYAMRENYLSYRDVIFINKRFEKNRFSRSLLLICGVSSTGRNILFAFAFVQKEDEENFDFVGIHFGKALANNDAPKALVIERNA